MKWELVVIESYIYTSCTSCRKTEAALKDSGVEYVSRDFFRDRFSEAELRHVLQKAGLSPADVLSKRSKVFLSRSEEIDGLDDDALLALMLEEPTLLRRPLVVGESGVVIGHNASKLAELIAKQA